jgi:hypothetical protein
LNLSHKLFVGTLSSDLGSLRNLESLDFSSNNLSGSIPSAFLELQSLETRRMASNIFSGCIPTGFQFATFDNLSYIPGNPGLRGFPVSLQCSGSLPRNSTYSGHSHGPGRADIFSVLGIWIGFAVGFLSVGTLLALKKASRLALFRLVKLPSYCVHAHADHNANYGVFQRPS